MAFRNTERIPEETDINKEERKPSRNLPSAGHFKTIEAGAGSKTFKMDKRGIWLGGKEMVSAPFSVDMDGVFKLLSLIGDGSIGMSAEEGLWIGAEEFADAPFSIDMNGVFKIKGEATGGKFIGIDAKQGIWLGAETFANAPFSVDMVGNITIKASSSTEDTSISFYDASNNRQIYLGFKDI